MSFWSHSPGPTWWHWFQSLNVCIEQDIGLLNDSLHRVPKLLKSPSGTRIHELTELNAKDVETLLNQHYQTFPRSKIFLSAQRIREGFLYDGWLGIGVYTGLKLIGCAISRDLGTLHVAGNEVPRTGLVDFFCVAESWRKKGIASLLLQELVILTAKKGRLVHVFQKEGLPISPLPPVWQSHYIWRMKGIVGEEKGYIGKEEIGTRSPIRSFNYAECIPYKGVIASVPNQLTGDSELYSFNYRGYTMNLCITDTFHRSVPEGWRIGEIQWILSNQQVPLEIQQLAIEALVDSSRYEVVLMDATLPHQKRRGWQKDSPYGYYLFNYNPGQFFSLKPHFVL
jgi:GNAT superfamily N-acetyltransferase